MNCQEIFTHSELRLAEDDLSVGLAIFLGKLGEYRLIQQTAVTVTSDGKTLVQGTDYTVSYSDNTNAGTATVTVTGTGIYSDMVTKSFEIAPKEITAALTGTTSKTYDGTMNPPTGLSLTLDGVIDGDDVTVSAGSIAYNSAGVQTADTITASGITLAGAAKDNYRLVSDTVSVAGTITKSQPVIAFSSSYAPDKAYDGQEIGNPGASDLTVTGAAFADVEFTWSATPQNAGTYDGTTSASVTAEVKTGLLTGDSITITGVTGAFANANAGAGKTVTVDSSGASTSGANADKYRINFPASTTASIEKADASVTTAPAARPMAYTGEAQALVSAGTASVGEVVYSLTETGPYSTAIPSGVNAGSYEVWYKIADTDNYNGATPLKVAAAISKVNYTGEKAGSTSGKFGVEKTYNLKALLPEGYVLGTPTVTDNDGIFSGVPTVGGTELHYTLADAAGNRPLDLTLTKTVTYTNGRETSVEIPEVGTLIETIIPLPMEMQGKGSYTVYRVHNGVAESLPQDKGSEYYKVSSDKTSISVFANRYSVYAIAWSDKAETPPTPPTPPTPSRPTGGGGGSAVRTYTITVEKSEHGKVTANRTNAASGTTVTLTVTPDTGYVPLDLAVTDSQGNSISLTDENTFTMPARAVAVKASFAPVPDENQEKPCDGGLAPRGRPHGRRWRRC